MEDLLKFEVTTELGPCQVRSKTDLPCPRPAVVELGGILFCEPCARKQEAYFAIGTLTQGRGFITADRELAGRITQAGMRY